MRKLNIANRYQPSKTVLLELEYLTEMATLKQLSPKESTDLLYRIRCGDATAIPALVESYRLTILETINHYLKYKFPIAETINVARVALEQLARQDLNNNGRSYFQRFANWSIHQAILQQVQDKQHYLSVYYMELEEEISSHSTTEILARQIPFLNNLNNTLKETEKEIIRRAKEMLLLGKQRLTASPHFSSGYEVEITVDYYREGDKDPVYTFFIGFRYRDIIVENNYGLLGEDDNSIDWRESYMPILDEHYCYLLHDLIDHPKEKFHTTLSAINRIWLDVSFTDQCCLAIDGLGNGVQERKGE